MSRRTWAILAAALVASLPLLAQDKPAGEKPKESRTAYLRRIFEKDRASYGDFKGQKVRLIPSEDLLVIKAVVNDEHIPRHWYDALGLISFCPLDWDYLVRRAKQFGARRVLSLLLYAQSNDLIVPSGPVKELFDAISE